MTYSCLIGSKRGTGTFSDASGGVVWVGRHVICSQKAEFDAHDNFTVSLDFITEKEESVMMSEVEQIELSS